MSRTRTLTREEQIALARWAFSAAVFLRRERDWGGSSTAGWSTHPRPAPIGGSCTLCGTTIVNLTHDNDPIADAIREHALRCRQNTWSRVRSALVGSGVLTAEQDRCLDDDTIALLMIERAANPPSDDPFVAALSGHGFYGFDQWGWPAGVPLVAP